MEVEGGVEGEGGGSSSPSSSSFDGFLVGDSWRCVMQWTSWELGSGTTSSICNWKGAAAAWLLGASPVLMGD